MDLFNKKALQKAQQDYRRVLAKCEGYRVELEDVYAAREMTYKTLTEAIASLSRQNDQLVKRLVVCDEARKSLGDKLKRAQRQIEDLQDRLDHKTEQLVQLLQKEEEEHGAELAVEG